MNKERIVKKVLALLDNFQAPKNPTKPSPIQEKLKELPQIKELAQNIAKIRTPEQLEREFKKIEEFSQNQVIQLISELKNKGIIKKHFNIPNMNKHYYLFLKQHGLSGKVRLEN